MKDLRAPAGTFRRPAAHPRLARLVLGFRGMLALVVALLAGGPLACSTVARPDGVTRPPASGQAPSAQASEAATARSVADLPKDAPAARLRLLTYNVLASPIFPELRMEALFALLEASGADVIALQEVGSWMLKPLLAQSWVKDGYHVTTHDGLPFAPGGQLILARPVIERASAAVLMGDQRRTALVAEMRVDGRLLAVATSHMESFLEDGPVRARQLDAIFAMLEGADDAVLMGDLNFGDGAQPETAHLDHRYLDLWTALRSGEPGLTWSNEENPMASIGAFATEPSRRLDRILVRSSRWQPRTVEIVGNHGVARRKLEYRERAMIEPRERESPDSGEPVIDIFPSDHYGLLAVLE